MNLYDAIYMRKSVRKYKEEKLNKDVMDSIKSMLVDISNSYEETQIEAHVVEEGEKIHKLFKGFISNYIKIEAPHYIIVTSNKCGNYMNNIGVELEKVILNLTTMAIGTCWVGAPFKKEQVKEIINIKEDHEPIILIAFGEPEDVFNMYRRDEKEFKRKELREIIEGQSDETINNIINAARLAPSATNSQPWRFKVEKDKIHVFCMERNNFITKKIYNELNKIDIGIAISHLVIAAENFGLKISFENTPLDKKGYRYVTTVIIK